MLAVAWPSAQQTPLLTLRDANYSCLQWHDACTCDCRHVVTQKVSQHLIVQLRIWLKTQMTNQVIVVKLGGFFSLFFLSR